MSTIFDIINEHVVFRTKGSKAFGERLFWQCRICKTTGNDEPALGLSAQETAHKHFESASAHFRAVAFLRPSDAKKDDLAKWMNEEMGLLGFSSSDFAYIASDIAHAFYRQEIAQRDRKIADLTERLESHEQPT